MERSPEAVERERAEAEQAAVEVRKLAAAELAAAQARGPALAVVWERVVGHAKHEALIRQLQGLYGRRSRRERRAFVALCRQAARRGLLRPATAAEVEFGREDLAPADKAVV